jgi:hypothetical protein
MIAIRLYLKEGNHKKKVGCSELGKQKALTTGKRFSFILSDMEGHCLHP